MRKLLTVSALVIVVFALLACPSPLNQPKVRVSINTGLDAESRSVGLQSQIDSVKSFRLIISSTGETAVTIAFTTATHTVELAPGTRTFTLEALDAGGTVLFRGSKT